MSLYIWLFERKTVLKQLVTSIRSTFEPLKWIENKEIYRIFAIKYYKCVQYTVDISYSYLFMKQHPLPATKEHFFNIL